MSKQPFLPLFFGDFLASTAEWTGEERSLYLTLLGHQWSLGSLPTDMRRLCRLVDWDADLFEACWPMVSTKFHELDGRLINRRLEEHREKARAISEKNKRNGKLGADARWLDHGERHADRHSEQDGDRNQKASGERHRTDDDASRCHPSHPIPSDPEPKAPVETVVLELGVQGEEPYADAPRDNSPRQGAAVHANPLRQVEAPEVVRQVRKTRANTGSRVSP